MKLELSFKQKIGSMLIAGFPGIDIKSEDNAEFLKALNDKKIGSILLYSHNIESSEQLKKLTYDIFQANSDCLIFVDQEGGRVQRLNNGKGFKSYLSAREIAKKSPPEAYEIYLSMARELKEHGINGNFGPVVDLEKLGMEDSFMGDRSYSSKVDIVVDFANAFINAHKSYGIATSLKHFPGHGYASGDTHEGLVDATTTFKDIELEPFYALINNADMVMTAHILNKNIDPEHPATMSKATLDKLRNKNFNGVIVSDDLHMGAVINIKDNPIKSIKAGCDMIIYSNNYLACKNIANFKPNLNIADNFINTILLAVEQNLISQKQIDDSYERILKLKSITKKHYNGLDNLSS